jgi:hypothetical protein
MSLRARRFLLRLGIHSAMLILLFIGALASALSDNASNAGFFVILLVIYLATLHVNPVPRMLEQSILKDTRCPYCGEVIELVSYWSCGCGYVSWEPRHGLSPCPDCKKVYDRLQCPRCDASIKT